MSELVVDTSVAFKWFAPDEPGAARAADLLEAHLEGVVELIAPASLPLELANALRWSGVPHETALELVAGFGLTHIELAEMTPARLARATSLAYEHGLTVYDAVFLALAEERGCALATADRKAFAGGAAGVEIVPV